MAERKYITRWLFASRLFSAEADLLNTYRKWTDVETGESVHGVPSKVEVDFKNRNRFLVTLLVDGDNGHIEKTIRVEVRDV